MLLPLALLVLQSEAFVPAGPPAMIPDPVVDCQLAFDPLGRALIAFQDGGAPDSGTSVFRLESSQWHQLGERGDASVGRGWYSRLAFDAAGRPLVVTRDYGLAGAAGVQVYDEQTRDWSLLGGQASLGDAHYTDIAVTSTGEVWIVYTDRTTSPIDRVRVRRFDGTSWQDVGPDPVSTGFAAFPSLAFGPGDLPCVAYTDYANGERPTVATFDGQAWTALPAAGLPGKASANTNMAIDSSGRIHVAWLEYDYAVWVQVWTGAAWEVIGNAPASAPNIVPALQADNWRLLLPFALDDSDRPLVAYQEATATARLVVRRFDRGRWADLGASSASLGPAHYPSLRMDRVGRPWVAFSDGLAGGAPTVRRQVVGPRVYCPAAPESAPCDAVIRHSGVPSLSSGSFSVQATELRPRTAGFLLVSRYPTHQAAVGLPTCIGSPRKRLGPVGSGGDPNDACSGVLTVEMTSAFLWQMTGGQPVPLHVQWWWSDPTNPAGWGGLSPALSFLVEP